LLGGSRIAGLLQKTRLRLLKEGLYRRIKRIEVFTKPQCMELIASFLQGLGH